MLRGGIHCVTPKCAIAPDQIIPRIIRVPPANVIGKYGSVPMQIFQRNKESSGMQAISILDLETIHPVSSDVLPSSYDFLWLYGKCLNFPSIPGWNGFMELVTAAKPFEVTQVLCLPFINAPPSKLLTLYLRTIDMSEKSFKQKM